MGKKIVSHLKAENKLEYTTHLDELEYTNTFTLEMY